MRVSFYELDTQHTNLPSITNRSLDEACFLDESDIAFDGYVQTTDAL